MSTWSNYYQGRVGNGYANYCKSRYKPFIDTVLEYGESFREEGCGISTISRIVAEKVGINRLEMFDFDQDQVYLSRKNLSSDKPKVGNIFNNHGKIDVIFSHGVLEHFKDDEIKQIVKRQKQEAKRVIHYVPTNKYVKQSFGDERLMSVKEWIKKFSPNSFKIFNGGFDLILEF